MSGSHAPGSAGKPALGIGGSGRPTAGTLAQTGSGEISAQRLAFSRCSVNE